jgi:hypothetical protein
MLDIDYRAFWSIGKGEFTIWFVPACLLTNLVYARKTLKVSWAKSAGADLVMTTASWVVTVALPIWLLLGAGVQATLLEKVGNVNATSWSCVLVLVAAAVISTGTQILLLRCFGFRGRFAMLALLNTLCIILASYRTWTYVISHPPLE